MPFADNTDRWKVGWRESFLCTVIDVADCRVGNMSSGSPTLYTTTSNKDAVASCASFSCQSSHNGLRWAWPTGAADNDWSGREGVKLIEKSLIEDGPGSL